ncbi:MAG: 7,8-didemethyl-8-hydroxy-5-deazariboflavin synthase subunit CofG [Natronomonas sp.]
MFGASEYGLDLSVEESAVGRLCSVTPSDVTRAEQLSFARNVFVPLTTACRYTCGYCTYYDPPGEASLLTPEEIREVCERGARVGCTEALFTFGDDPDDRYTEIHEELAALGHDSIHSYLRAACEIALDCGLLPHSNPGDQTETQMKQVADRNASMGVMLETTAQVDAHAGQRRKEPGQRLATIDTAGRLGVPFTTGILVGIGETRRDRAESLLAIEELHRRHGHVQEVIVQPVSDNERWSGSPDLATLRRATAMARVALPPEVSVQSPPNLAPVDRLLDCGVDDFGGVSPVTDDHINPDYAWPAVERLETIAAEAGVELHERLAVHDRYVPEWLSPRMQTAVEELSETAAVASD